MFDIKNLKASSLDVNENDDTETILFDCKSDILYGCGVPELTGMLGMENKGLIEITEIQLSVYHDTNQQLCTSDVALEIYYSTQGTNRCHHHYVMSIGVDFSISDLMTAWMHAHEKFTNGFYDDELMLLKDYVSKKFSVTELYQEYVDRGRKQDPNKKNRRFEKYGTPVLMAVNFMIMNHCENNDLSSEITRLRIMAMVANNLKKNYPELDRYDEGYHDALVHLLDEMRMYHEFESFEN